MRARSAAAVAAALLTLALSAHLAAAGPIMAVDMGGELMKVREQREGERGCGRWASAFFRAAVFLSFARSAPAPAFVALPSRPSSCGPDTPHAGLCVRGAPRTGRTHGRVTHTRSPAARAPSDQTPASASP